MTCQAAEPIAMKHDNSGARTSEFAGQGYDEATLSAIIGLGLLGLAAFRPKTRKE
jgi:hypothetical protein